MAEKEVLIEVKDLKKYFQVGKKQTLMHHPKADISGLPEEIFKRG